MITNPYFLEIEKQLNQYNISNNLCLKVDTIRVDFSKQHKLSKLEALGGWHKLSKNSKLLAKLKKRLAKKEITSVYQLEDYPIYYFRSAKDFYRNCTMVIYGLSQYKDYHHNYKIIDDILTILFNRPKEYIVNIDLCHDSKDKPNITNIKEHFKIYNHSNNTFYINKPYIDLIEKFYIYNKAFKNNLDYPLYRFEFKTHIRNIKDIYLPLDDIRDIITLAQNTPSRA